MVAYYKEGFNPVKIWVTDKYVRAVRGGMGEVKTAGNYAASLYAGEEAHLGYTQVLWLDGVELKYIAVLSPVGEVMYKDKVMKIGDGKVGKWSQKFFNAITDIQYGVADDPDGWVMPLD